MKPDKKRIQYTHKEKIDSQIDSIEINILILIYIFLLKVNYRT